MTPTNTLVQIEPSLIKKNPDNPRRYFNDERLDQLRTSIQEVGILVPLIVYEDPQNADHYVLMDGERRWICSSDLGLDEVPANVIEVPTHLDNLLRMFNIHNVREDWPLISVALSLKDVIIESHEDRESRIAELTGLTRATVRRAKKLLTIPDIELDLIQKEAHLDREKQTHREDLYLEIDSAESVLRNGLPEIAGDYTRPEIIRQFAMKREMGSLRAVTDFRFVGKLVKAFDDDLVSRADVVKAVKRLIDDPETSPSGIFDDVAALAYKQQSIQRKSELLVLELQQLQGMQLSQHLIHELENLRERINALLDGES